MCDKIYENVFSPELAHYYFKEKGDLKNESAYGIRKGY